MSEIEKVPTPGGNVNEPASGTQGDIAETQRLRQALPGPLGAPGGPGGTPPPGVPPGGGPASLPPAGAGPRGENPESAVRGIPGPILEQSDRPGTPVESPLAEGPIGGNVPQMAANQQRLQIVSTLAQSDDPDIREWAELVMELLIGS